MNLVWFKRDLRLLDHPAISAAVTDASERECDLLGVYIYEPIVYEADEFDVCHLYFINDCLKELRERFRARGGELLILKGEAVRVLEQIRKHFGVDKMWSHEEAGNMVTYERDIRVGQWASSVGVDWTELPQNGVIRRLKNRDGWAEMWLARMVKPILAEPEIFSTPKTKFCGEVLTAKELGLEDREMIDRQVGGETEAVNLLESFLHERGMPYTKGMSSPVTAYECCSRLSPHISYGSLSVRVAYQMGKVRAGEISIDTVKRGQVTKWRQSLRSYTSRLWWHCHFMQKIEDQPDIDWVNIARVYDGLRGWNEDYFEAWKDGQTGYPMVDACMRALKATGWLNFRMRAMVMSFASYHLWLDWRKTGVQLARYFVDYEPGIHWSQVQMQSGTTGINSIRVYSPRKQIEDHDPEGEFIRKWVPELASIPNQYLAEPHLMPPMEQLFSGLQVGGEPSENPDILFYPAPIVDHMTEYKKSQSTMFSIRKTELAKQEAKKVYQKHGSRRSSRRKRDTRK